MFDHLGGAIRAEYKKGWDKSVPARGARIRPPYPGLNEWTVDWVASLLAAKLAGDRFGVIELGAGYGHWMVVSILAFKQLRPSGKAHGIAVEADSIHFEWLQRHVDSNLGRLEGVSVSLHKAAAGFDGEIEFPVVDDPSANYGASYGNPVAGRSVKIPCLSLESVMRGMDGREVDLLHCDIQGAEEDLVQSPSFRSSLDTTGIVLFGTHRSNSLHERVVRCVRDAGFHIAVVWPRNRLVETAYGRLQTHDGAVLGIRPDLYRTATSLVDFDGLQGTVL